MEVNRLGVVVGVERSLKDPGREDDAVLSGHVVGINCRRSHTPPAGGEEGGEETRRAEELFCGRTAQRSDSQVSSKSFLISKLLRRFNCSFSHSPTNFFNYLTAAHSSSALRSEVCTVIRSHFLLCVQINTTETQTPCFY